jgi:hypothetical protein
MIAEKCTRGGILRRGALTNIIVVKSIIPHMPMPGEAMKNASPGIGIWGAVIYITAGSTPGLDFYLLCEPIYVSLRLFICLEGGESQ